jgi:sugar phosphate isomerase/epimerase
MPGSSPDRPRTGSMHPRTCVSAISTFRLSLADDLAFWHAHGITNVGVSVAKLEAHGWENGTELVVDAVGRGLHVVDLIGLGPFHLAAPRRWDAQRERLLRSIETAVAVGAQTIVFTTGPFAPLPWEEAADALEQALAPVLTEARTRGVDFAIEHTNSLRVDVGFVHTLRDAIDLARRLDTGVCMELNACWAERGLATTIRDGIDRVRLVQVSDFKVGTVASSQRLVPGDGDIPTERILRVLVDAGYGGYFELELIGDAIVAEGYDAAVPRAVGALDGLLRRVGA